MPAHTPELQVLDNYIGKWSVEATSGEGPSADGQYVSRWVLDDRFVQTVGSVTTSDGSNDFEIASMATYDQQRGVYRWWTFMSNGHTETSEGIWEAKTRIMTRITCYGDITQTTKSQFTQPGIEEWTMTNTDEAGSVISEMSGTNRHVDQ